MSLPIGWESGASFLPITERSKTKPKQSRITIDILLKIALYGPSNSECTRLNEVLSYFQVSDLVTWW